MFPILLKLGPLTLHTYGLLVAAGFLSAYTLARRRFEKLNLPLALYDQLIFIIMVSGILGARLFYVGLEGFSTFRQDPLSFFRIWEGGLVFFGSFIGAMVATILFALIKKLPVLALSDILVAPLLLAQAIGRLGCYAAGCCYGRPTHSLFGVVYSNPDSLAPLGVPLHATQIYSSIGDLFLFLALLRLEKKNLSQGILTASYLIGYGCFRFLIEFVRNDDRGPLHLGLWPSQWISLVAILIGISLLLYVKKTKRT